MTLIIALMLLAMQQEGNLLSAPDISTVLFWMTCGTYNQNWNSVRKAGCKTPMKNVLRGDANTACWL